MHPIPDQTAAGQESVWDFPRPATAEQGRPMSKLAIAA